MKFKIIGSAAVLLILIVLYVLFSGGTEGETVNPEQTTTE